jgi:hypothetical protein
MEEEAQVIGAHGEDNLSLRDTAGIFGPTILGVSASSSVHLLLVAMTHWGLGRTDPLAY